MEEQTMSFYISLFDMFAIELMVKFTTGATKMFAVYDHDRCISQTLLRRRA